MKKKFNIELYNKRLLAIAGTLLVGSVTVGLLIGLSSSIERMFRNANRDTTTRGVVVDQNQVMDTTTYHINQQISILNPFQLDTISPVFVVPIGQKNKVQKRVEIHHAGGGPLFGSSNYSSNYRYNNFKGVYNNFVLIDYTRNIQQELFTTKVALTEWSYLQIDSTQLIVIQGTDMDTNEDGVLNANDLQCLFVFDLRTLEKKVLRFENETVEEFKPLRLTSKIYVRTGKDVNMDNKFDAQREPTDLYFYDVQTGNYESLVPEAVKERLVNILN